MTAFASHAGARSHTVIDDGRVLAPRRSRTAFLEGSMERQAFFMTLLLFGGYLFPSELQVRVGEVLTGHRISLLLCVLPVLTFGKAKIARGAYVPVLSDFTVLALAVWCPFALVVTGGAAAAAGTLGQVGIDLLISYAVGRLMLGNVIALRAGIKAMVLAMAGLLLMGMVDWVAGENIFARLATAIVGNSARAVHTYGGDPSTAKVVTTQYRFGLPRARGPIEHAILYGAFFTITAPIMVCSTMSSVGRLIVLGGCAVGVVLSISSAPILAFVLLCGFLGYDALFRRVRYRWTFLVCLIVAAASTFLLLLDNPVDALITSFTLDPQTGYTRLLIWKWIGQDLAASPWMGLGAQDWFRPATLLDTIDCLWLNLAYQFGYVGLGLFLASMVGCFFVVTPRRMRRYLSDAYAMPTVSLNIALFLTAFVAFTVHFWGAAWSLFGLVIGTRAGLAEALYLAPPARGGI